MNIQLQVSLVLVANNRFASSSNGLLRKLQLNNNNLTWNCASDYWWIH